MTVEIFDTLVQGSDEWLQARAGIATASTVGKLLTSTGKVADNETARTLTETLIAERITGHVEYTYPTRDMQRGTMLEPHARALYSAHYAPVTEIGFARLDTGTCTLGASPDGLVGDDGGIEIKSPRPRTHLRTLTTDRVPTMYLPQIQACMLVLDRDWWEFVSYCPGLPLYVKRVHADEPWQDAIVTACEKYEATAAEYVRRYEAAAQHYNPTDYFDPFAEEEII